MSKARGGRGPLQRTSRYMACVSRPMELRAVQRYCPAWLNCTYFRVREDTRASLRTTTFPSRLCEEEEREREAGEQAGYALGIYTL